MSSEARIAMRTQGRTSRFDRPEPRGWAVRSLLAMLAIAIQLLVIATPATAYWSSTGSGTGSASTGSLAPPTDVTVPTTSGSEVPISWTASTSPAPVAYYVERRQGTVVSAACGTSPVATTSATSCVDTAAAGTYTYRVIAVQHSWTAASAYSEEVTVSDPAFLGAAASFSVLGVDATDSAESSVSGDLGVTPMGVVAGFDASNVGGDIHINDATAAAAAAALNVAYNDLAGRDADTQFPGDPNGLTFGPGVHHTIGAMTFTGSMTLDAGGDPDAIFIFQVNGAITTAANSHVLLVNGAKASNVYWQVNGASGHGANSTFSGSILAVGAITLGVNVQLIGRALSKAAVTLGGAVIRFTIAPPPTVQINGGAAVATQDTTPTIEGTTTALAGRPVTVTVGGQILTTTVQAGGTWSVTAADLAAGTYSVVAKIRDAAGNGGVALQALTVEVNPPPIALGAAATYSVLTEANVVGTGTSNLSGELGVTPGTSVTGFPPGTASAFHLGDGPAAAAASDADAAFADGAGRTPHTQFADPSGLTFHTGVHHTSAAVVLTGAITLDAQGDPSAVFIFQVEGAMTTAASSSVVLTNGAQASNVFWIVHAAFGMGADSLFAGTVITPVAATIGNLAQINGRVLAGGTVTLANNTIGGP